MKSIKKKALVIVCAAAMLLSGCIGASAYSYPGYQIATTSGAAGGKCWLDDNNKRYTGVTMTKVSSDTMAEVQLWKNWFLGDVHCPEDQVFRNSSGNSAWWFGDGEADYHIYSKVIGNNGQTVTLKGTFQDY